MTEQPGFKDWLQEHHDRFKTYSLDEISDIAIACGWDRSVVAQWLTSERFKGAA
jgi:hypothetical protein